MNTELKVESKENSNKIILDEEKNIGVVMKEPTAKNFEKMATLKTDTEKAFFLIRNSIDSIFDSDSMYDPKDFKQSEMDEWLNNLNRTQINKIYEFYENLPVLYVEKEYTCEKCKKVVNEKIKGFQNFL